VQRNHARFRAKTPVDGTENGEGMLDGKKRKNRRKREGQEEDGGHTSGRQILCVRKLAARETSTKTAQENSKKTGRRGARGGPNKERENEKKRRRLHRWVFLK